MEKVETQDELVQKLIDLAQEKKSAIAKAETPNWLTNSSFSYSEDGSTSRMNIRVINDVGVLVKMLGFLNNLKTSYDKAAKELDYQKPFTWLGFTYEDWVSDFKLMVTKINITKEKKKLEDIEKRLDKLISPELKKKLELEAIQKELGI